MKEKIIPTAIPRDIIIPIPRSLSTLKKSFKTSISIPEKIENISPKIRGSFISSLKE
jgi:hypothetical protein